MGYTALYRKYRPDTFEEVKGQDHVVTALRNQIISDRVAHAYLFCGTRGTGKTSVAKIFAKAVNCEHPVNGSPCGECASCRAISEGSSLNVIEIDAASNNSVDDVRAIRDEVAYSPTEGRYKVYIIDEVHMLSTSAFNALLKTLEEPPSYVIFILATTEAQKVPATILSRCQRYDFRRISQAEITDRLRDLFGREGIEADEKALHFIARKADGGMRDALSLADQCISFYLGQKLTYDDVLELLGAVDSQVLGSFLGHIFQEDIPGALRQLADMLYQGRDISQLCVDLTGYLRDLLLLRTTGGDGSMLDVSAENLAMMQAQAQETDENELMRDIRIFSDLITQLRGNVNRRILFETALIRMCRPQMETDVEALTQRIRRLEKMIESGQLAAAPNRSPQNVSPSAAPPADRPVAPPVIYQKAAPQQLQRVAQEWAGIVEPLHSDQPQLYHAVYNAAKEKRLKFDTASPTEDVIYVVLEGVLDEFCKKPEAARQIEKLIQERLGKMIHVQFLSAAQSEQMGGHLHSVDLVKTVRSKINMPVEEV